MKATIRLTRLVNHPSQTIITHFITPIRAKTSEDWSSAKIFWGAHDSRKAGDTIDLELIVPTARLSVGDQLEIFTGGSFEVDAEVVAIHE